MPRFFRQFLFYTFFFFANSTAVVFAQEPFTLFFDGVYTHTLNADLGTQFFPTDFDQDGDMDLAFLGRNNSGVALFSGMNIIPQIGGGFAYQWRMNNVAKTLPTLRNATLALTDFNQDGQTDIAAMGISTVAPFAPQSSIWLNQNNAQSFSNSTRVLEGLHSGSMAFADSDNDGDSDLAMCGFDSNDVARCLFYRNDGTTMTLLPQNWTGLALGKVIWNDLDRDGDHDLLMFGTSDRVSPVAKFYRNQGKNVFTESTLDVPPILVNAAAFGDYDNDGDDDLLISGIKPHSELVEGLTFLFKNDGKGNYQQVMHNFLNVGSGDCAFADFNHDGWLDVAIMGADKILNPPTTTIYQNLGQGFFKEVQKTRGFIQGNVIWGDYDGDSDLDLMVSGRLNSTTALSMMWRNEQSKRNDLPNMPKNLKATQQGNQTLFSWTSGGDANATLQPMSYNLIVGTQLGTSNIMAALGNTQRIAPQIGNVGQNTTWKLENLPKGTYYWTVQAIDASLGASVTATSQTFAINATNDLSSFVANDETLSPSHFALAPNFPNPFQNSTTFQYHLPQNSTIELAVYDVTGKQVRLLTSGMASAGRHERTWDGKNDDAQSLPNGVYLGILRTEKAQFVQKVTILK